MNSSILILRSQEQGKIIEPLVDELLEPLREAFYAKHEDADHKDFIVWIVEQLNARDPYYPKFVVRKPTYEYDD